VAKRRGSRAKIRKRVRPPDGLSGVRRSLQAYADRGVFRAFTERPARAGRHYFRFVWLAHRPFTLTYEPKTGTVTFTNVLPRVPARSALYDELKRFVEGRAGGGLPSHRRIDPRRAKPSCSSRRGTMLVHVVAKRGHHAYGANRAVHLVHEIFLHLHSYFPEYLWENYDVLED
jgi:hypothetical protein